MNLVNRLKFKYFNVVTRRKFIHVHPKAHLFPDIKVYEANNFFVGENTGIDFGAVIMNTRANFYMGKNSTAAFGLSVVTGNHERKVKRLFLTIKDEEKGEESDKDVIVEEDCWLGINVTLLSGITVRRGTTVAAGSVVAKSTLPYSVVGGVPAKHIKFYWTIEQILEHESALYPEEERYTRQQLEAFFSEYPK